MRRIGIFGGSFDPVHNAHLALACIALDTLGLDELRWVPAGVPWQRTQPVTAGAHRVAMLELAIAGEPRFVVDACELDRDGASYTIDTVRAMQRSQTDAHWFLIIGQDQLANLPTWHRWAELLPLVTLAVAARPRAQRQVDAQVQQHGYHVLPLPSMDISATAIRLRVSNGEAIDDVVPPSVARYIDHHGLYRADARS